MTAKPQFPGWRHMTGVQRRNAKMDAMFERARAFERAKAQPESWKVEVIADSSGQWCGNGLRFATEQEAQAYGLDLAMRWTAVREYRATQIEEG